MKIAVFNGAGQVDYMYGLVSGLTQFRTDSIDVLDSDETQNLFASFDNVAYYPVFRFLPRNSSTIAKIINILRFYFRQIWYLLSRKTRIVHFQWLDRYIFIDRVILPGTARLRGHKVVLTVHNINAGKRDDRDNFLNRLSLKILYNLSHHLIVHTSQSKLELIKEFSVSESKVSVIRHGMNNRVALKGITTEQSRNNLNLNPDEKIILFFGNIDYYKGLDLLIDSLKLLPTDLLSEFRLIIAGNSKIADYTNLIIEKIDKSNLKQKIILRIGYIPDEEVEQYFMAADCIVLPYRKIYQSGVIFMAYTFGLPIIVADIGNFRNDMVEGKTGFLLSDNTPEGISKGVSDYFNSGVYKNLQGTRTEIKEWALRNYSWNIIGAETHRLYESLF